MRRPWLIHLVVALSSAPHVARAQWQLSADAGVSRLQQAGLPEATASSLGATLDIAGEFAAFRTSALGSHASGDRWTGQWFGAGSLLTPQWNGVRLSASSTASAFGQTRERPVTSIDFLAQAQIGDARRAFAVGGGSGATAHAGTSGRFDRAIADGWWAFASDRASGTVSITRTPAVFGSATITTFGAGETLWDGSRTAAIQGSAPSYVDASADWSHDAGAWSTELGFGVRQRLGRTGVSTWEQFAATVWVAPQLALTAAAGRTLDDLVRGVPHTRFFAAGLRIATGPHLTVFHGRGASGPRISVSRLSDGQQRIEVRAAGERVVVMADFTDWTPVALERDERAGGVWHLDVRAAPGPHRLAIQIDDGPWIVPANLPRATDDFGGVVGIITVP
jgi:hypothetical protein